jgi:hypothetical protein
MWTPNRNNGNIEYVGSKEIDIKRMLINVINDTTIDYNRGFNKLWDMGLDDSKDKKYYVFDKPIVKPNFINVAFILERIILKNNNWEIDKINVFPATGGYCGCQNIDLQFEYTNKDIWNKSMEELATFARELGYEPVKGCPISFTQEVLFRKIGTWNKPYIMRSRRSKYFKKKWGYLSERRLKHLVDCYRSKIFNEKPYLRKKDEIKREAWYSMPLSKKMPKHLIEELNKWFDVLNEYEWIWNFRDEEETLEATNRVKEFMKNSKLGLRTLYKNADRLYPVSQNGYQTVENMILKYEIAWKMYDRVASSWCRDWDDHYRDIMGIGEDHKNDQGNYYL